MLLEVQKCNTLSSPFARVGGGSKYSHINIIKAYIHAQNKITICTENTSIFSIPEQTRSRSSSVPVPVIADIGSGENLISLEKKKRMMRFSTERET